MNHLHYSDFSTMTEPFKGILLDAYGVFWGGNKIGLLPDTKDTMQKLVSQNKVVGILSNTTQLVHKEIHKLHQHGLIQGIHYHFFMTSGEITKTFFLQDQFPFPTPNKKFWLWGEVHPHFASHLPIFEHSIFKETSNLKEADFIYISIPHLEGEDQIYPEVFRQSLQVLQKTNLPMVCSNPDHFAHEGIPPQAVVRQGSIAAIYEEMGGSVFYIGKPYSIAYEMTMPYFNSLGIHSPSEILMIGDTPETDIRGGNHFGMSTALITQTGMMGHRMASLGFEKTFKELQPQDKPCFLIKRLAYDAF